MLLNEATFLDNLKTRYYKDKIYVSTLKTRTNRNGIKLSTHFADICGQHINRRESVS